MLSIRIALSSDLADSNFPPRARGRGAGEWNLRQKVWEVPATSRVPKGAKRPAS